MYFDFFDIGKDLPLILSGIERLKIIRFLNLFWDIFWKLWLNLSQKDCLEKYCELWGFFLVYVNRTIFSILLHLKCK